LWPAVAADALDRFHITYSTDGLSDIFYRTYGDTLGNPLKLTSSGGFARQPTIGVTPAGFVHIAWNDTRSGVSEIYYISGDGVTWSGESALTTQGAGAANPAIAVDTGGDVHVVWEDRRVLPGTSKIFYRRRAAGIWAPDQQLTFEELTDSREPAVAVDLQDRVHVVWKDERVSYGEIYYRCWEAGAWGPEERIMATIDKPARTPAVACDAYGNVHAVWSDNTPGIYAIYYSIRNTVGWSQPIRISTGIGPARNPAIAVDESGEVYVAWDDGRTGTYGIYFTERVPLPGGVPERPPVLAGALSCEPNPFCGRAVIRMRSSDPSAGAGAALPLTIFAPDGRCVRVLAGSRADAGLEFVWDGTDEAGRRMAPGTYFYRLEGPSRAAGRIVLIR